MKYAAQLNLWLKNAIDDSDLINELKSVAKDEKEIEDRFYKELEFGTGGLRGVIGAGTNRINVYTIAKATQGLSQYINSKFDQGSVAIAYDSRIKSDLFARAAASVFAANGIKVYLYKELMPTPMLSYAVRELKCSAGIVVTASHNPSKYNGYKVYGPDGCQLTLQDSQLVLGYIENTDVFNGVKTIDFNSALSNNSIEFIEDSLIDSYLNEVYKQSINKDIYEKTDLSVVYSPLNGAGNKPVRAILNKAGVKNLHIVKTQELPDGNFPTAPYPNPEIRQAFEESIKVAQSVKPDILLATDPDCDRIGIAVSHNRQYTLMSGNEVGILLLDYILTHRKAKNTLPENPVFVKTIVTSNLAEIVAKEFNCEVRDVLTGFKFIGEQIGLLEQQNQQQRFIFGFEESYGYLAGSYVRDKDAVVASMLICEMAAYYKSCGKTLIDVMNSIYEKYGYYLNKQVSFTFEGVSGMQRMADIMSTLSNNPPEKIGGETVTDIFNYNESVHKNVKSGDLFEIKLPQSNVISFMLQSGGSVIVRPSGTEPKIKIYLSAVGKSMQQTLEKVELFENDMSKIM